MQRRILNTSERDTRDESIDVAVNSLGEAYGQTHLQIPRRARGVCFRSLSKANITATICAE